MKFVDVLPLALVLTSSCAVSQQSSSSLLTMTRPLAVNTCPAGLDARHGSGVFSQRLVHDGTPEQGQRILLSLTNLRAKAIVSAQITVHGLSQSSRMVPLARDPGAPDLARSLRIAVPVKGNGQASSDLVLPRFAAVTSLELNSITYSDKSVWKASAPGACSAVPNGLMLLSAAN